MACRPLVQDKSSAIWTWPTFLPFGNAPAPTVAKPPPLAPEPLSAMAIESGISALVFAKSATPNSAVYHNTDPTKLLTRLGLITHVWLTLPCHDGWLLTELYRGL